jgi:signal transduction histidine kinase
VLNNTVKHSQATEVLLSMGENGQHFTIVLADNGRGFSSPAGQPGHSHHHGLHNIQRRLVECGGYAKFTSVLSQGTCVTLAVPIPPHLTNH